MNEAIYTRGRFVWADMMSRDPASSAAFYTELMGWSIREVDLGPTRTYSMLQLDEAGLGGIVPLDGAPAEIPSHWIQYVSVDDVDAACAAATRAGGRVCVEPFDIAGIGRSAIVEDPGGAVIHPYRSAHGESPETETPSRGEFCWYENMSSALEQTKAFYTAVFGWSYEKAPFDGPEYWIARRGERQVCGLMAKPETVPRSSWLAYLLVDSLAECGAAAERLGATRATGRQTVPGVGSFEVLVDPAGAAVALFEAAASG